MFESLSNRLSGIFEGLTKRGALREADVDAALREVRVALLEADVALPVVKDFIDAVRERAVGHEVLSSVTPGQMMIKVVHDNLVEVLGTGENEINLVGTAPVAILMVGLQGSGKTTTSAKLAKRLQTRDKKKVLMASLDIYRPAAQQQLAILGEQGEAAFNRCQADIISHCIDKESVVVLLEECVVLSEQCRKLLSSEFVVYLKASIPTQLGRMKNGRVPSLPVDDMKSFLEKQHHERDAFYEEVATLIVESVGYSDEVSEINTIVEEDVNKVIKAIEA